MAYAVILSSSSLLQATPKRSENDASEVDHSWEKGTVLKPEPIFVSITLQALASSRQQHLIHHQYIVEDGKRDYVVLRPLSAHFKWNNVAVATQSTRKSE